MNMQAYSFKPGLWPTVLTIILLPLFISLGFWQLDRAGQKRAIHARFVERFAQDELLLDETLSSESIGNLLWRRARVTGHFDPSRQFLLDNQIVKGRPGYFVYTPFKIIHTDQWILVNRGWVAAAPDRSQVPDITVPGNLTTLTGVLKPEPATGILLGDYPPENLSENIGRVQKVSLEELSGLLDRPLLPGILRLDENAPHGYVRNWALPGSDELKHQGYAFQWFSFAGLLVILYIALNLKKTNQ